jgi:hypothetical protein
VAEHCILVLTLATNGLTPHGRITCLDADALTIQSPFPEENPRVWVLSMSCIAGVLTGGQFQ